LDKDACKDGKAVTAAQLSEKFTNYSQDARGNKASLETTTILYGVNDTDPEWWVTKVGQGHFVESPW
jgi:hypothetical protein